MCNRFELVAVNVSKGKGTPKIPVPEAFVDERGIAGDAHAGRWHRQVSLLAVERIESFAKEMSREIGYGEFAENLTIRGLDTDRIAPLDRIIIGDVVLEATQIGKSCHGSECGIFKELGRCVMPKEGVFCRVRSPGRIHAGDAGRHEPRALQVRIITSSDRVAAGVAEDRSGPRLRAILDEFFQPRRWHAQISAAVLPDDSARLRAAIEEARAGGVDALFITGGTGVGPRDITPETVMAACDKTIPGIMEAIRMKTSASNPRALLSRSVAGVAGEMLVYALPGSVRAVEEYMEGILPTMEHLFFMVRGIDVH
ncbi:MAG TPA: molybdopterin-binding protein [Candidatus Brocadiia bacterium]|nr:molybdopterin-binding protein [Candidatus Brocadiia bacterium]